MVDIITELQHRKDEYLNRYKELYSDYKSAPKLSDEARGRYVGRLTELSFILIDVFGMSGRDLQQIEDLIDDRLHKLL